jgi:hypothetical protein
VPPSICQVTIWNTCDQVTALRDAVGATPAVIEMANQMVATHPGLLGEIAMMSIDILPTNNMRDPRETALSSKVARAPAAAALVDRYGVCPTYCR